jgi:CHAT domain-containing protein
MCRNNYNRLAFVLAAQGKHAEAEQMSRTELAITQRALSKDHPVTGGCLDNVGAMLLEQGKYAAAEPLLREGLEVQLRALGSHDRLTAFSFNNLAVCLGRQGKHAAAEVYNRKALAIREAAAGNDHEETMASLSNLATNLTEQGKHFAAEPLHRRVLMMRRTSLGDEHPLTALSCNNLAAGLSEQDRHVEAEPLFRRALSAYRKVCGEAHPNTARAYDHLAFNLESQGKPAEAEPLCQNALAIRQRLLGEDHIDTATSDSNVAFTLHTLGRHIEAQALDRKALTIWQRVLGEAHENTAMSYNNNAVGLYAQARYDEAAALANLAVASLEGARLYSTMVGLDRAAVQKISPREVWSFTLLHLSRPAEAYQALEGHLGRGLLDDLTARQTQVLTPDEQKEREELSGKLAMYDKQIGNLLSAKGGLEANREKFEALVKERQVAETALAQLAARLQQREIYDWRVVQKRLPADTALVTWLDWAGHPKAARPQGEHWAFLLKATGEPIVVELMGAKGAWNEEDTALAAELRPFLVKQPLHNRDGLDECRRLGEQRFGPLEPHLKDIKHLIVLPSEALAGIPLEALTERFTVSYAPSGTIFARLMEREGRGERARRRNLLALGDPAYPQEVKPLPGTRREVTAIGELFDAKKLLLGEDANAQQVEQLLNDDQLKTFDVLHFAMHGEQNPHVQLYTRLRLAKDGQITAGDIYKDWKDKLDADLVVLSACETGLGRRAGGEGYLGFTQPLFLAGARSIILSQWSVDDRATALLMMRFYQNWLGRRAGDVSPLSERGKNSQGADAPRSELSKAEALKEAKVWLKNLTHDEVEAALGDLNQRTRGLKLEPADTPNGEAKPFAHPFYWSGFILIGDPR